MRSNVIVIALVSCVAVLNADGSTNDILATLRSKLEPIMATLDTRPEIIIDPICNALNVTYLPQTNKVHRVLNKRGDISADITDEIGPSPAGFILYVREEPKGSPNQLRLPQAGCDITTIDGTNKQLFWRLYSGSKANSVLIKNVIETIRGMKYLPNKASEAIGATNAPQPQR